MKIYSMTATFGKLEKKTLTLLSGLNIIVAPNEWGKSTWCAFLVTMLYGLETRVKTTKATLADKEKYAPWSGSPMAGRIDLNWNGRDITIERWTKGRTPLGEFRAYETETGLEVVELTGANCGQVLLGVEKSVFTRAGFVKLSDLPVTQDESLRRRLNALVTTGDESGAADSLSQKLKDLKNKCRHNRTGLLPQAESELAALKEKKAELDSLRSQSARLRQRQAEVERQLKELNNHRDALLYAAAQADAGRVALARNAKGDALANLESAQDACAGLPDQAAAMQALNAIYAAHQELQSLQMESQMLPQPPEAPAVPEPFRDMDPAQAAAQADSDGTRMEQLRLQAKKSGPWLWILGLVFLAAGAAAYLMEVPYGYLAAVPGAILLFAALIVQIRASRRRNQALAAINGLIGRYGSDDPAEWALLARTYGENTAAYGLAMEEFQATRGDLDQRLETLKQTVKELSINGSLSEAMNYWNRVNAAWNALADARRDYQRSDSHAKALESMAKTAQAPAFPDNMTYTEAETARLLADAAAEQQALHRQLGQCQGRMEAIGQEGRLDSQIVALKQRIARLEDHYAALEYAQGALAAATAELQRRFAPKIAARAQDLFSRLTGGRYERLTLGEDLSLSACAQDEATLHSAQWRSDGTADQLYLALRLAVAEELTPQAPLILDDALVRFDDERLKTALSILREESREKQVILFTCQDREKRLMNE